MLIRCKYECGFEGESTPYVGFFPQEAITEAYKKDQRLPKYGFHLGIDCPKCRRWQKWIKQTDEEILNVKFYKE